jgi:hypothetical protein
VNGDEPCICVHNEHGTTHSLIPGAWHTEACYDVIIPLLEDSGYATTSQTLPSVGAEPPVTSTGEDTALVHSTISELAEAGRDVVVVMHSYGGIPGSDAMKASQKTKVQEKALREG